jgi:1-acyl-sn-glycerol-3-phosphate acyltransferase
LPAEKSFWFRPQRLEIHFLPAISSHSKTTEALKEEVFSVMRDHYLKEQH